MAPGRTEGPFALRTRLSLTVWGGWDRTRCKFRGQKGAQR